MESVTILVDRDDLDNAVFSAAQEVADKMAGLTSRQKVKFALETADTIMASVDSITEAGKRSAAGRKAAEARHGKNKNVPTPGPAIPPPQHQASGATGTTGATTPPVPQSFLIPPDTTVPPPPHPALAPGVAPFGAPPA